MLTPEEWEIVGKQANDLYNQLELEIIQEIAERIANVGYANTVVLNDALIAQEMGMLYQDIISLVAKYNNTTEEQIRGIFENAGIESLEYDDNIYKLQGLNPIPLKQSKSMWQLLTATAIKTHNNLSNLVMTTANTSQTQFYNAMNKAYMEVSTGVKSYSQSIVDTIKEIGDQGAYITYPSGQRRSLESAVRTNIVTGVNQTCGKLQLMRAKEMDCDLMEITAHGGARPDHAQWQGKIVSRSGKRGYLKLKDIGYGTVTGFKGVNCHHDWHPYYEGSARTYTDEMLDEYANAKVVYNGKEIPLYDATQMQRRMERQIRNDKKEIAGLEGILTSTNKDAKLMEDTKRNLINKKAKLKEHNSALNDFVQQTGLRKDYTRLQVASTLNINKGFLNANNDSKVINSKITKKEKINKLTDEKKTSVLKEYEKIIRNKNVENAVVINEKGQVFLVESNSPNSVYVKNLGKNNLKNSYMTHNHPKNETYYSLSAFDISEFMETGMKKLRGVDHKYTYEIERIKGTIKANRDDIIYEFGTEFRNKALDIINEKELNVDEDEYHIINILLAEKYKYKYRRFKNE